MTNKLGCDVSQWNLMEWKRAKAAGIQFAFIKATEGTTWVDPQFTTHWKGAKAEGIDRGAYHFFRNTMNAGMQADHFVKTLGGDLGELPLVVDVEDKGTVALTVDKVRAAVGATNKTVEQAVRIFCNRVLELTGKQVMIYTSPSYITTYFKDPAWSQSPLWLANYISTAPSVPSPWHPDRISYWQFRVDVNGEFYGVIQPAGAPKVKIDLDIGYS